MVIKRDGSKEAFDRNKILIAVSKAFDSTGETLKEKYKKVLEEEVDSLDKDNIAVEEIQDAIEIKLMEFGCYATAKAYIIYREKHKRIRNFVANKESFINRYKKSDNTANATVDDNSNVGSKNIGVLNAEIHKEDNIQINRGMVMNKLKELFPNFNYKYYIKDLEHHIIYKNDESSFAGAISPYCCSVSMYPFILNGIKGIGGLSAAPKNLDSFCGMYVNMVFAIAAMFAGAVATPEVLLFFTWYCKKEWGEDFWKHPDTVITNANSTRKKTIRSQIHQYWQQIIYSINQPAAARGLQSAFVNFSYFDRPFFNSMFENFVFPDGTKPDYESLDWIQREFMQWFNQERLRCILTFPVESAALIYKDGKFEDESFAKFIAEEYARGHSFFTYISDTADSLSSCCRLRNKLTTHEFSFTNGNIGVETGSKSVITLNIARIIQDWAKTVKVEYRQEGLITDKYNRLPHTSIVQPIDRTFLTILFFGDNPDKTDIRESFKTYLDNILERVYKYHIAYNELLWDMYDANLLPVYKAGFISLNKQYLTIGINGLNAGAEFLGLHCDKNKQYQDYCEFIFSTIKEFNTAHKGEFNKHKISLNSECVPAESLAIKNYNWDKQDGYWVNPDDTLYASYVFKPNDDNISVLDKLYLHGKDYIGDYLDGGAAAHINLDYHLDKEQYWKLLNYAGKVGCQYFTFNIPNSECQDCGYITKAPITKCPKCGSTHIDWYDRIIGYLTRINNWSEGRKNEKRVYTGSKEDMIRDHNKVSYKVKLK